MIKNKIDFKLINTAIIVLIITLLYVSGGLWRAILYKSFQIFFPFLIAFAIAYALYPYVLKLVKHKLPKKLSVFIVVAVLIGTFIILGTLAVPLLFDQLGSLFNSIITFIKEISMKYDIDFGPLQETLSGTFNDIIKKTGSWISNGVLSVISTSISYISTLVIALSASIYFLCDMEKIRKRIKKHYKLRGKKTYNYIKTLDNSMEQYLDGFTKIVVISLIEYTIAFLVIGHPNALLLGFLAALGNLIPYFGGVFTNIIALITSFVVSPGLFIRTLIVFVILSLLDSNVINPYVYGKTTNVDPVVIIFAVFAGGILFGLLGIVISLPLAIIIIATYKYFQDDIEDKIDDIRENNKNN